MPFVVARLDGAFLAASILRGFNGAAIAHGVTESKLTGVRGIVCWATVGKNAALAIGFTVAACGLFSFR